MRDFRSRIPALLSMLILVAPLSEVDLFGQLAFTFGPNSGTRADRGTGIDTDASGNVYVTGVFDGTIDLDPGPGEALVSSPPLAENPLNGLDLYVASYTPQGQFRWGFNYGVPEFPFDWDADFFSDVVNFNHLYSDLAVDGQGNVVVTGRFKKTVDFDPGAASAALTASGADGFVASYDSSGAFRYAFGFGGGSDADAGYAVVADQVGNVYVTGTFQGTVDFDPGDGVAPLSSIGTDAFVAGYGPTGAFRFAFRLGGVGSMDWGRAIDVDAEGNVYVLGHFAGEADFDPGDATFNLTPPEFNGVGNFVASYDPGGALRWAFSLPGGLAKFSGLATGPPGNLHVVGAYGVAGAVDLDPGPGVASPDTDPPGRDKLVVATYDLAGAYQGAIVAAGLTDQNYSETGMRGVDTDAAGNVYVSGQMIGVIDFDPGSGTTALTGNGPSDAFVASFSPEGDLRFAFPLGASQGEDVAWALAVDRGGGSYVTGSFVGGVDFDPGLGVYTLTSGISGFGQDAFVATYTATGELVFVRNDDEVPGGAMSEVLSVYPNPAGDMAHILVRLPNPSRLDLRMYDVLGRVVDNRSFGHRPAGEHRLRWSTGRLPNGLYHVRLVGSQTARTLPVLVAR